VEEEMEVTVRATTAIVSTEDGSDLRSIARLYVGRGLSARAERGLAGPGRGWREPASRRP
jgi:hypothetical protein